jgi:hypothetical protein
MHQDGSKHFEDNVHLLESFKNLGILELHSESVFRSKAFEITMVESEPQVIQQRVKTYFDDIKVR